MDDIQLCKDIMALKQELRKIVAVPGWYPRLQITRIKSHDMTAASQSCLIGWVDAGDGAGSTIVIPKHSQKD